jgi:UDP-2,3-diacylglucosamine pyrophosphatase LpxH
MAKPYYRTVWISDVHLGTKGCQAKKLLTFLKEIKCDTLYLVGDIIDGWRIRQSFYWKEEHSSVIQQVIKMSKKGTKVVYVAGNHDEFLRRYLDFGLEFGNIVVVNEAEEILANGKRLLVTHGDDFDGVTKYHKWLAFAGDKAYDLLITLNHHFNQLRANFGMGYWSLSKFLKHKVKSAVNFIVSFEDAVAHHCKRNGYDGVVCGHIHHAEIKNIDGVEYYNCGDWVESCTALVEDFDGNIKILDNSLK